MTASLPNEFDFIFEPDAKVDRASLLQGDLLQRTPKLARTIGEAHSHYADAPTYSHFLVLTQSCDLVRRKGECKSRYITICAVRPLAIAVERELRDYVDPIERFPIAVGKLQNSILARQFLERVLNNTVDGFFFIPKGAAPTVTEHLCAFLPLSVALRVEHYDACLEAKVGQATEIFAAKIGSLTSGLYGRIATPDLTEKRGKSVADEYKKKFFDELGVKSVAWLSPFQRKELEKLVKGSPPQAGEPELERAEAERLLKSLPTEVDALAGRAIDVLVGRKLLPEDDAVKQKAKNFLRNDSQFSKLARGIV